MIDDSRNMFGSLSRFCPGEVLGDFLQAISPVTQFSTLCGRILRSSALRRYIAEVIFGFAWRCTWCSVSRVEDMREMTAPMSLDQAASTVGTLKGSLGVTSIVLSVVATAAPLSVMVANSPLLISMGNSAAAPFHALVAMIIMFLFAAGFTAMSKYIKNAGAFYSYIQKGLGRTVGLGSATTALLSYSFILVALEAYLGYAISTMISTFFDISLPWWVLSLAVIMVVGFFGYRDIALSSKFLTVALVLEIAVVLAVDAAVLFRHGLSGMVLSPISPSTALSGSPGLGVMWAIFSFIGFEATVIFREEAKDPDRTIPLATYVAVVTIGLFYIVSMWCEVVGFGVENVVAAANAHPGDLYQILIRNYLGTAFEDISQILVVTSLFACVLSLHNIVVRYQYVLGKYGVLSHKVGVVHPQHGSPHVSSIVQTLTSIVALVVIVMSGLNPVSQIFAWGGTAGTIGYMLILSLTCVSIIAFFSGTSQPSNIWRTRIAPLCGLVGVVSCLGISIANLPTLVGGDGAQVIAVAMCGVIVAAFGFGCLAATALKRMAPARYEALKELA